MTLRPGSVFKDRSNPLASTNTFALCCFGFGVLLLFVEDLGTAGHLLDPLVDQLHLHRRHRSRDREANNSKETAAKWSKWTSIVVNVSHVVKHYDHICQRSFSYYIIYIYILSYIILYYITLYYIILCIHGGFQKSRYPQIIFISVTDLHGLTIASSITVLPPCWESPCQLEICCSMVICYIANWNLYPIYRFFTYWPWWFSSSLCNKLPRGI